MDRAVASFVLLASHAGTEYVNSLRCEAERESAATHSFSPCSEEAVGYKAITRSCRDAWVSLTMRQSYVSVRVPKTCVYGRIVH